MTGAGAGPPAAPPRSVLRIYLFALLGWTFDFYDLVLLGFLMDPVARDLQLSPTAKAWLLGVALGASGIGGIAAGALADRVGKRTMLAWTVLVYSAGSLVCGLAAGPWMFVAGRAIVGLGVGGEWAIGHGMLAESVAPARRGRWAAALQSGEPLGVALASVVGYLLLPHFGWRVVLVASSVTALIALAARRSVHLPDEPAVRGESSLRLLASAGIGRRLAAAWLLGVFKLGTYWTCYTWLPSFLVHEMNQPLAKSLAWMLTAQVGQLGGMLAFGAVSDRFGRRPAFAGFSLLTACALAPLAFAWRDLSQHPLLFWATMFVLGVGSGCTAGFGALLAELFPTEVRGAAMGTTYNLARAAQLLAPVAVQAAVMRAGLAGGLGVPLVLALATASWVWVLPETRGIVLRGSRVDASLPAMSVRTEKSGPVTTVILSRAARRNAVDRDTADALVAAFEAFDADASASVAVLWGEGGTFCAGADLVAVSEGRPNRIEPTGPGPMGPTRMALSKPVIAGVAGHAVAGGLELALWCDLRVAEEDAIFGVFCRRWGVPLIDGGTVRLPRVVGASRALDMILTGRPVAAREALDWGLASCVVPRGRAREEAEALAAEIAAFPQRCLRSDRRSTLDQWTLPLDAAIAQELALGVETIASGETVEGATRFARGAGRHGAF